MFGTECCVWNIATKSLPVQQKVYCWRDLDCDLLNFIIKLHTEASVYQGLFVYSKWPNGDNLLAVLLKLDMLYNYVLKPDFGLAR